MNTFTLDDLQKTIESLTPTLYYGLSELVDKETIYICKKTPYSPEYIILHPDNLERTKANIPNRRLVPLKDEPKEEQFNRLRKTLEESSRKRIEELIK